MIAARILTYIGMYLLKQGIGHVTSADGGFIVERDVYAPDVAFISSQRQAQLAQKGFNPITPDLASDSSNVIEQSTLRRKLATYLRARVEVWIVDTDDQTIEIYRVEHAPQVLSIDDTLTSDTVLPNLTLAVKDIFPEQPSSD